MRLVFAKTIFHPEKSDRGVWLRDIFKIWDFPFNIVAVTEASNFEFGTQPVFAN